jgi:ribosomal protein L19E
MTVFERIQKRIDFYEELRQLRREVRVLRHENGIKTDQINDLLDKLKAAKARDKMHEDERANLNAQVIQREQDALAATENLKRQQHENAMLREQMEPLSCDGCIHAANYRKCASCARYPKIRDKYETEESI